MLNFLSQQSSPLALRCDHKVNNLWNWDTYHLNTKSNPNYILIYSLYGTESFLRS